MKTYASQLLSGGFEAPDQSGMRQQLHVTVSGHPTHQNMGLGRALVAIHTVEHGISYDERVLIKHRA